MLKTDQIREILELSNSGLSAPTISHKIDISLPTVYKYLKTGLDEPGEKYQSMLDEFKKHIKKLKRDGVTNKFKIYQELVKIGYKGSRSTIYRFFKNSSQKIAKSNYRVPRFETIPGEQAQMDWGYVCKITIDGKAERLYFFVYVLGWSRAMYVEFTTRQNLQTLEESHIHAFEKLGITKTILYDNMKTVILRREKISKEETRIIYNPAFLDFAQHFGFKIRLCRPYWPRTKGKVERGVGYVKINFLQGLRIPTNCKSLEEINNLAQDWLEKTANSRIHGTTKEIPNERWAKEKIYLNFPRDFPPYTTSPTFIRRSTNDCMVLYKWNYYEVPGFPRRKLYVKEISESGLSYLEIYFEYKLIQKYRLSLEKGEWLLVEKSLMHSPAENSKTVNSKRKMERKERIDPIVESRPLSYYDQFIPHYYGKES